MIILFEYCYVCTCSSIATFVYAHVLCVFFYCHVMQTKQSQCRFDWLDRSTCLARANGGANVETPNPTTRAPTSHPTTKLPTQIPTTKNPTTKPTQSINILTDFPTFSPTESKVSTPKPTPRGTPKPTRDCTALWHVVSYFDARSYNMCSSVQIYHFAYNLSFTVIYHSIIQIMMDVRTMTIILQFG